MRNTGVSKSLTHSGAPFDSALRKLARRHDCWYTRFADDITFSFKGRQFPESLARLIKEDPKTCTEPGSALIGVVESNGFHINHSKVRLLRHHQRQEVTGLVVNNRLPSVRRSFLREIRAMLHLWEARGLEHAQREFREKHYKKHRSPDTGAPSLESVLRGKVAFVGMVQGLDNARHLSLRKRLADLSGDGWKPPRPPETTYDRFREAVWVLKTAHEKRQGTGFLLNGYGLVTCAHVVCDSTVANRYGREAELREVTLEIDEATDLALGAITGETGLPALEPDEDWEPKLGRPVTVVGFPDYSSGNDITVDQGKVISERRQLRESLLDLFVVNAQIVAGNSGGPVLNDEGKVVGVAVKGAPSLFSAAGRHHEELFGVLPLRHLSKLRDRAKQS